MVARRRSHQRMRRLKAIDPNADEESRRTGYGSRVDDQKRHRTRNTGKLRGRIALPTGNQSAHGLFEYGREPVGKPGAQAGERGAALIVRGPGQDDLQILVQNAVLTFGIFDGIRCAIAMPGIERA